MNGPGNRGIKTTFRLMAVAVWGLAAAAYGAAPEEGAVEGAAEAVAVPEGAIEVAVFEAEGEVGTAAVTCTAYAYPPRRSGSWIVADHTISCTGATRQIDVRASLENISGGTGYRFTTRTCYNTAYCTATTIWDYATGPSAWRSSTWGYFYDPYTAVPHAYASSSL
jgi:hypothetical protein